MRRAQRPRLVIVISAALAALIGAPAGPVASQGDDSAGMCLLTLDEVREATGLPFASSAASRGACTYASDPSVDMYAIDLRIDTDASLDNVRFEYDRGGQDVTVAGLPAWSSDDGLFVDVGDRLLIVQPVFFLSDATPDPVSVQGAIGELAVPRVGAAIDAAYGAEDRLAASFPAEVAGQPLFVDVMNGQDFLRFVDLGTAQIEGVLADRGLTLADVTVGSAFVGDETEIFALQATGLDAALLVAPVSGRLAGPAAAPTAELRAGRDVLAFPNQRVWLYVDGDTLWVVSRADEATLDAVLDALP